MNKVVAKLIMSSLPSTKPVLASKAKPAILKSKPYRASPQCVLCEFVMNELKSLINENSTKVAIKIIYSTGQK